MKAIDAAYLAGLVDGDGSIFISRRKSKSAITGGAYRLFLSISGQNEDLLAALEERYGRSRHSWDAQRGVAANISWEGPKALEIIEEIRPYLIGKRAQAKLAGQFPCMGRGLPGVSIAGRVRIVKLKAKIFNAMRKLNYKWSPGKTHRRERVHI